MNFKKFRGIRRISTKLRGAFSLLPNYISPNRLRRPKSRVRVSAGRHFQLNTELSFTLCHRGIISFSHHGVSTISCLAVFLVHFLSNISKFSALVFFFMGVRDLMVQKIQSMVVFISFP